MQQQCIDRLSGNWQQSQKGYDKLQSFLHDCEHVAAIYQDSIFTAVTSSMVTTAIQARLVLSRETAAQFHGGMADTPSLERQPSKSTVLFQGRSPLAAGGIPS